MSDERLADDPNPLLTAWIEAQGKRRYRLLGPPLHVHAKRPETDAEWREAFDEEHDTMRARDRCTSRYAWAIPDDDALDAIAKRGPIVEVHAGLGYWSALLRARGVDVVASDIGGEIRDRYHEQHMPFTDVETEDAETFAARYPDRTLLIVWPPYRCDSAYRALRGYLRAGGRTVIYVGEHGGGCTGDDTFHRALRRLMIEREEVLIPTWDGIRDSLVVYDRKP